MSWMDVPPCGSQACGSSAGDAKLGNLSVQSLWRKTSAHAHSEDSQQWTVLEAHGRALIRGAPRGVLVGQGGHIEGDTVHVKHNAGFSMFSQFSGSWSPDAILQVKLLGKRLAFSVDLSEVGCACNLAVYLISMPARGIDGKPNPGRDRGGQPEFYCDANKVGGQWCPEMDIMEANTHAFASTPHKCDAPINGFYSSCDRGGCGQNTRESPSSYGPGASFTIDTTRPFDVHTDFFEDAGVLTGMRTTLVQGHRRVVLDHKNCDLTYLEQLSAAMAAGMSLRITYWGDQAESMSWLDAPPCGPETCSSSAGDAKISNISLQSCHEAPAEVSSPSEVAASSGHGKEAPLTSLQKHSGHLIDGLSSQIALVGQGGRLEGDALVVEHNSGFSLFSKYTGAWRASGLLQLKLLGKRLSFSVDLSEVGCACNLALYLISMPARGRDGQPNPGDHRGGQPAFYCDANKVGGQWCPEMDIMEANTHAFASTPHKCDAPVNGFYSSCDRGGCGQNTRESPSSYGPGASFTIDTTRPFDVHTDFFEDAGVLTGMRTTLVQGHRRVVLDHKNCDPTYLEQLSAAMAAGMSLRITYWGDQAESMSWLDAPPCGPETCSSSAGDAKISNISLQSCHEAPAEVSSPSEVAASSGHGKEAPLTSLQKHSG